MKLKSCDVPFQSIGRSVRSVRKKPAIILDLEEKANVLALKLNHEKSFQELEAEAIEEHHLQEDFDFHSFMTKALFEGTNRGENDKVNQSCAIDSHCLQQIRREIDNILEQFAFEMNDSTLSNHSSLEGYLKSLNVAD
jgi:hypothetical protein